MCRRYSPANPCSNLEAICGWRNGGFHGCDECAVQRQYETRCYHMTQWKVATNGKMLVDNYVSNNWCWTQNSDWKAFSMGGREGGRSQEQAVDYMEQLLEIWDRIATMMRLIHCLKRTNCFCSRTILSSLIGLWRRENYDRFLYFLCSKLDVAIVFDGLSFDEEFLFELQISSRIVIASTQHETKT